MWCSTIRRTRLEYFDDPDSQRPPVVLAYGNETADAVVLRGAVDELASGKTHEVHIDQLPGFQSVDGCSLAASVGSADSGVEPLVGSDRAFRCVLRPGTWSRVSAQLEPFEETKEANGCQYLSEEGPIEWIISRDRSW